MHSPAHIISQVLVALGLAVRPGASAVWPVTVGTIPQSPDNAIGLYDTAGVSDGKMWEKTGEGEVQGKAVNHSGFQVRVRAKDYPTAYAKAYDIAIALDAVVNFQVTISGSVYLVPNISRRAAPLYNGPEPDSTRQVFTINALVPML